MKHDYLLENACAAIYCSMIENEVGELSIIHHFKPTVQKTHMTIISYAYVTLEVIYVH